MPEGIVVPPPVIGNDTNDGGEEIFDNGQFVPSPPPAVLNRARQEQAGQQSLLGNPSQNRGQNFQQPPAGTPAPTRTPQLVVEQSFDSSNQASFSRFQPLGAAPGQGQFLPQPAPSRPQLQPAQAFQAAPQAQFQPAQAFQAAPQSQQAQAFQAAPQAQPVQAFDSAPRPQPQQAQAFEAAQQHQQTFAQPAPAPRPAFNAPTQNLASFSQDTHFEERPSVLAAIPPNAVPARGFGPEDVPQQHQPFTSFAQNSQPIRQGRLPSDSAEFPEAPRSQPINVRPEAEEAPRADIPETQKPVFNPNRARSNVRHQQNQLRTAPVQAATPIRIRPQAETAAPVEAAPVRTRLQPEQTTAVPVRAPVRAQPAHRQPLPGGQLPHVSAADFRGRDEEQFQAPVESSGPPPQFESFPIQGSSGGQPGRFQAAPSFQPQPTPAVESFRPEEEPQAAPVRIRPRPQETQSLLEQAFQPQQPVQDLRFDPNFQQPSGKFENLVQEFTGRSRSGRAEFQDFQPQPVFKFNPVPAVPDL